MKQIVPALNRQHRTPSASVADRRPHCINPQPDLARPDSVPRDLNQVRSTKELFNEKHDETGPSDHLSEPLETVQLERLAKALLSKDSHDLAALAAANPALIEEWQQAFQAHRNAAERTARYWASAAAVLATIKGFGVSSLDTKSTH